MPSRQFKVIPQSSYSRALRLTEQWLKMSFRKAGMSLVDKEAASALKRKRFQAPNARLTTGGQVELSAAEVCKPMPCSLPGT